MKDKGTSARGTITEKTSAKKMVAEKTIAVRGKRSKRKPGLFAASKTTTAVVRDVYCTQKAIAKEASARKKQSLKRTPCAKRSETNIGSDCLLGSFYVAVVVVQETYCAEKTMG